MKLFPGLRTAGAMATGLGITDRTRVGIASPWADNAPLTPVILDDVFGLKALIVTRAEAMGVPAMVRARNLLAVLVGRMPLRAYLADDTPAAPQPTWITATDTVQNPFLRMVWTVDDLLFYGESLWEITARDTRNFPLRIMRVPWDAWEVDPDAVVLINGAEANPRNLIYFESFVEGVLVNGARSIRMAAGLDAAALDTARAPFKLELHQESDDVLSDAEIKTLVADARAAIAENMGVLYTNRAVKAIVHAVDAAAMLTEGRNASAVDMARLANVPAASIDAVLTGSGITYQTGPSLNRSLVDYGAAGYLSAISARLSQDDVTPRGQRVAFDLEAFLGPLPGIAAPVGGTPAPVPPAGGPAPVPADSTEDFGGPL